MRFYLHAILAFLVFLTASCGSPVLSGPVPVLSSPIVLNSTTPYLRHGSLGMTPEIRYSSSSTSNSVHFVLSDGSASADVSVRGATGVLWVDHWEVGGTDYVVLTAVDANDKSSLFRLHDSNSDGLPDASTLTLVVDSGANLMYWGDVSETVNEDGLVFVLDDRCKDVLVLEDLNQDGWPESLRTTPFAKSADFSHLLDVNNIVSLSAKMVVAAATDSWTDSFGSVEGAVMYKDSDADLVADTDSPFVADPYPPSLKGELFDGQTSIVVEAGFSAASRTIEVWELDVDGDDVTLLGSAVLGAEGNGTVFVSALAESERIGVRFQSEASTQLVETVIDDRPQLIESSPVRVRANSAQVLTLYGVNLSSGTIVKLQSGTESTTVDLTVQSVSGTTEITVDLPSFPSTHPGFIALWAVNPSSPDETAGSVGLAVHTGPPMSITSFTPTTAGPGSVIRIVGTGFKERPICSVDFGGGDAVGPADITCISDTELDVVVPADAATGVLTIDHSGFPSVSSQTFTAP